MERRENKNIVLMLILILINQKCPTGDTDRSKALTTMIFQIFWRLLRYVGQLCSFMCMCAPATCLVGCFSFESNNFHQITEASFQEFHGFHFIMDVFISLFQNSSFNCSFSISFRSFLSFYFKFGWYFCSFLYYMKGAVDWKE